jgi:hypothetical protein
MAHGDLGCRGLGCIPYTRPTVLHRWPAKLPIGPIEIIRNEQTTVWIATSEGLLSCWYPQEQSFSLS